MRRSKSTVPKTVVMNVGQMRSQYVCLFVLGLLVFHTDAFARQKRASSADSAQLANALKDRRFIFVPQQMIPMSGRMRSVTPDFTVKVSGDTVRSYLPYVGQAYTAPMDASKGPLDFTTPVHYDQQVRKKGGWTITLKPTDARDVQRYVFTVFNNGTTTLQVTSTNRQPISYNGYLKPMVK